MPPKPQGDRIIELEKQSATILERLSHLAQRVNEVTHRQLQISEIVETLRREHDREIALLKHSTETSRQSRDRWVMRIWVGGGHLVEFCWRISSELGSEPQIPFRPPDVFENAPLARHLQLLNRPFSNTGQRRKWGIWDCCPLVRLSSALPFDKTGVRIEHAVTASEGSADSVSHKFGNFHQNPRIFLSRSTFSTILP